MLKRMTGLALVILAVGACAGSGATATPGATPATATQPAATQAGATQGTGAEVDPNTIAGFCQLMTDSITSNWPPSDAAAATVVSPLLRNWSNIAAFKDIAPDLLAVADWTASMSIMSTVPAPPAEVATAYDRITAFQSANC